MSALATGRRAAAKGAAPLPSATGGIARMAYLRAQSAGLDAEALLASCGLTLKQAEDPHMRLPVSGQIAFLEAVASAVQDDLLGFHLGTEFDLRELGLLFYVAASCETLGDALHRVARYSAIQNEGILLAYDDRAEPRITFNHDGVRRLADRHQIEFFVTTLLRICRHLTGRTLRPSHVGLQHRRGNAPLDLRRFFGCPVEFESSADEIRFPASARTLPVLHADAFLNGLLVSYCDEALARRRSRSGNWRVRVENALVPLLPHGNPELGDLAQKLGVSPRTLARRLASEGTTFAAVLQELRLALATRYLQDPKLQISEAAWLLGYKDSSAFSHAFRRWTGHAPRRARNRARGA